jgi:hypothetical protein
MKDIFYHALLVRAAYSEIDDKDTMLDKLKNDPQSAMHEKMAEFIQSRFDFVASSLDNDGSIEFPSSIDPTDIFQVNGYDGIVFKEKNKKSHVTKNKKSYEYY